MHQILQAGLDVTQPARHSLVVLGGEVDEVLLKEEGGRAGSEHPPQDHLPTSTRLDVGREVFRILLLERQSQTASHHPHTVDGIDERVGSAVKDVAGVEGDVLVTHGGMIVYPMIRIKC